MRNYLLAKINVSRVCMCNLVYLPSFGVATYQNYRHIDWFWMLTWMDRIVEVWLFCSVVTFQPKFILQFYVRYARIAVCIQITVGMLVFRLRIVTYITISLVYSHFLQIVLPIYSQVIIVESQDWIKHQDHVMLGTTVLLVKMYLTKLVCDVCH